jgi:hypothetical protein
VVTETPGFPSAAGRSRLARAITLLLVAAALLAAAPLARASRAAGLSIVVNFSATGVVSVTLPDGTPVGTTSGAPTVIPAGFYTLTLNGPGECINLPLFELRGPGVNINDDMLGGEVDTHALYATFLPNSTYTWHLDRSQSTVYTFRASADVVGTAPSSSSGAPTAPAGTSVKPTSEDIVGSAIAPFRGRLTGAVSAAGRLTLAYKGKSVSRLKAGRYTIAVDDRSSTSGFMLERLRHAPLKVTGPTFVGRRSTSVQLTAGRWLVLPRTGLTAYAIVVS